MIFYPHFWQSHLFKFQLHRSKIIRKRDVDKWKVDDSQFRGLEYYPFQYCHGFFVALSGDLISPMTRAVNNAPHFWIDDIFLFGLLPHMVGGVTFVDLERKKGYYWTIKRYI